MSSQNLGPKYLSRLPFVIPYRFLTHLSVPSDPLAHPPLCSLRPLSSLECSVPSDPPPSLCLSSQIFLLHPFLCSFRSLSSIHSPHSSPFQNCLLTVSILPSLLNVLVPSFCFNAVFFYYYFLLIVIHVLEFHESGF